jgi:hypothetical protein
MNYTKLIKDFKDDFRLISIDPWATAIDAWFEAVGQMYLRNLPIPTKYDYKPGIAGNTRDGVLNSNNWFHSIFDNMSNDEIVIIAEYIFRYCKFFKQYKTTY